MKSSILTYFISTVISGKKECNAFVNSINANTKLTEQPTNKGFKDVQVYWLRKDGKFTFNTECINPKDCAGKKPWKINGFYNIVDVKPGAITLILNRSDKKPKMIKKVTLQPDKAMMDGKTFKLEKFPNPNEPLNLKSICP